VGDKTTAAFLQRLAKEDVMKPIAYIHNDFKEKFGIPRQSGRVDSLLSTVVFEPPYRNPDALRGIEGFSHLWLIFDFSKAHREAWSPTVRPPRLGGNKRIGVFASRSPFRPNPIGLSSVRLVSVEEQEGKGMVLVVSGADLLDGTPIYDVKPYLPFADSHPDAVGGYADSFVNHRLKVSDPDGLLSVLSPQLRQTAADCIAEDPRPSYQDDPSRVYSMRLSFWDVRFTVEEGTARIFAVDRTEEER